MSTATTTRTPRPGAGTDRERRGDDAPRGSVGTARRPVGAPAPTDRATPTATPTAPGRRGVPRSPAAGGRPAPPGSVATPARARTPATTASTGAAASAAPFVLLIMVLLTGGLVATLWLSTAAAADSYRLEDHRRDLRDLSEQSERLRRDVEAKQSAPAVAADARRLGLVPAGTPAVLYVHPDGSTQVIGTPTPVTVPPVPAPAPSVAAGAAPAAAPASPAAPAAASTPPAGTGR